MTTEAEAPILDAREAPDIVRELLDRIPGYVPGWLPAASGPSWALLQIFARYMQTLTERLNEAPARNKLAFLDLLGINLLPAQAARAPVVFKAVPNVGDSRVPARTRVGASLPGSSEPVVFETENAIALTAARLTDMVTLWPARDAYANHSAAMTRGEPFTLFQPLMPVPHELYLAHDILFAFGAGATVEIEFELATPGSQPLSMVWEYWDGQVWRPFTAFDQTDLADSVDGTDGLTHSGIVRLRAECGESRKTTVDGIEGHWVRARLDEPLAPDPARALAIVDRIRVRSVLERETTGWNATVAPVVGPDGVKWLLRDEFGAPLADISLSAHYSGPNFYSETVWPKPSTDADGVFDQPAPDDAPSAATATLAVIDPRLPLHVQTVLMAPRRAVVLTLTRGLEPDAAFADGFALDTTKTFEPLGPRPSPGSTFYLASREAFAKPGATVAIRIKLLVVEGLGTPLDAPVLSWQYWNGRSWTILAVEGQDLTGEKDPATVLRLQSAEGLVRFVVPVDLAPVEVNSRAEYWIRATLVKGAYGFKKILDGTVIELIEVTPPAITIIGIGYRFRSQWDRPEHCLTYNDFRFEDHTRDVHWPGSLFPAFRPVADTTPALYLGFDRPLPTDYVSLYLDVQEESGESDKPRLKWEYWDGDSFRPLSVRDETRNLALPGIVAALWPGVPAPPMAAVVHASGVRVQLNDARQAARFSPGDLLHITTTSGDGELTTLTGAARDVLTLATPLSRDYAGATIGLALLPRFGAPRTWMRARLEQDGAPLESRLNGAHVNAVWAAQLQTFENEVIGSGDDEPGQVFFLRQTPVLVGEAIEVRELQGPRAAVELPMLREEVFRQGLTDADVRIVNDRRTGAISEVWVRWRGRPHLFFSGSADRHYVIERSRSRVLFGNGRVPPAGKDNVRVLEYRAGGGLAGNVPAGALSQLLSGILAQSVANPRAAEGGADGEAAAAVSTRGPHVLRHRGRTSAARDYEALAREASPAVALARALPTTHPSGRPAPGWVTVIIVPHSRQAEPVPSFELRRQVHDFLIERAPAAMTAQIAVVGPTYLPVGVEAVVAPLNFSEGGVVFERVQDALATFLHPLRGGPDGQGWPFGRDVYISDVAATLEAVEGVDCVPTINLLLDGTPRGERVEVPPDRIVVAGPLLISLSGSEL